MTSILFLVAAVVVAGIGIGILMLANRKPGRSSLSSIDEFARRKNALAPRRPLKPDGSEADEASRRRGA